MQCTHGGDTWPLDPNVIDFSSNINPLGMPNSVQKAALSGISDAVKYPDPLCRRLKSAISKKFNLPADTLVCGSGGADIIYTAALAVRPKHVLVTAPTFSEYAAACSLIGADVKYYYLDKKNNYSVGIDILDSIHNLDAVFMCSPNNPTGRLVPQNIMQAISYKCLSIGAYLFADESFIDFIPNPSSYSLIGSLNPNTAVIRSFTKMYAMPGLRLGFAACGSAELAEKINACLRPWSVSTPAQYAGIAALDEDSFVRKSADYIAKERNYLTDFLYTRGVDYIASDVNYILFRSIPNLDKILLKYNILIRNCSDYKGLDANTYRIAVKSRHDNELLVSALTDIGV